MRPNSDLDLFDFFVIVVVLAIFCFAVYAFLDNGKTFYEANCPSGIYEIYENRNFYYLVETDESISNVDNCLLIKK